MSRSRIYSLEALRAIAYTAIFISHAYECNAFLGSWGVSVFLVMSGFVMTLAYWNRELDSSFKGCISFAIRNIAKLYPLHLVMLAAAVLIRIPAVVYHRDIDMLFNILRQALLDALMLQSWIPISSFYNALNGVSWYLSVIFITSLIFPLLINQLRKATMKTTCIFVGITIITIQVIIVFSLSRLEVPDMFTGYQKWATYRFPIIRIPDFALGGVLATTYLLNPSVNEQHNKDFVIYSLLEGGGSSAECLRYSHIPLVA